MKEYSAFLNKFLIDIKNASENDKLALFIGSGISINSGMPSWKNVIEVFAKELGIEEFGTDDYLDIPEKYYRKYGVLEYNKILESSLNANASNLDIQKKLYDLNPSHIITTNWDELLEAALNEVENNEYSIVSNDHDLSRTDNSKLIIKMHGCISNIYRDENAIVMKYSDYLNYDKNFPLVDVFVKSIFSTKRVLFIGYSLADKNVQQILDFVKTRTNHHIYPYFIVFSHYNKSEYENYKKQGIFLIFIEDLISNLPADESKYKLALEKTISKITGKSIDFENNLELLLSRFSELNFIDSDILIKNITEIFGIRIRYNANNDDCLYFDIKSDNLNLLHFKDFFEKTKTQKNNLSFRVLKMFLYANITGINWGLEKTEECFFDIKEESLLDFIFDFLNGLVSFDYNKINTLNSKILEENLQVNERLKYKLQQSFILYKQKDFMLSLETLKKVKKESFLNKNYFFNGVSKTNINNICRLLKHDGSPEPDICKDFNIKRELSKLPSRYLNNDLKKIVDFSYFYKKHVEIQDLHDKNIETYDCFANGESKFNNHHCEIYNKVYDVFSMINRNFLAIDFLKEIKTIYRKSFEAIVFNFSINGNLNKKAWFKPQKFEYLDEFIFYIGVTSFDPRDLDVFLNKTLESKLIFLPEEINKIITKNINNIYENEYNYFENAIIILSFTKLTMPTFFKVIKLLTQSLDEKKI